MSREFFLELNDLYDYINMYETAYIEYADDLMRQSNPSYNQSLPF